jgi:hypothetical protein
MTLLLALCAGVLAAWIVEWAQGHYENWCQERDKICDGPLYDLSAQVSQLGVAGPARR